MPRPKRESAPITVPTSALVALVDAAVIALDLSEITDTNRRACSRWRAAIIITRGQLDERARAKAVRQ